MISQMSKSDVCSLIDKGVKLDYEEIIQLNALGCRCENHPDSLAFYALPRCAFIQNGDFVLALREPTIGADLWFQNVLRIFNEQDETTTFILRLMSMVVDFDLPKWSDVEQVSESVRKFIEDRLKPFTARQLMVGMNYCLLGCDGNSEEFPVDIDSGEDEKKDKNETPLDPPVLSTTIGVIHRAQAMRLGIPVADMEKMTAQELQAVLDEAIERDAGNGSDTKKVAHDRYVAEYYATLNAIKEKHNTERK